MLLEYKVQLHTGLKTNSEHLSLSCNLVFLPLFFLLHITCVSELRQCLPPYFDTVHTCHASVHNDQIL